MKKNLRRRKVEMVKITNERNLNVTFSKRRTGLFKKASELTTLCGVEIALVVFSPAQRVYSFGHPSVDNVFDRYQGCNTPETSITSQLVEGHRESNVHQLNMELTQLTSQLEDKKKLGEELNRMKKENQLQYRWQYPVEELDLSTLQQLKSAMEGLKKNVQAEKLAILNANPHMFYTGNSSPGYNLNPSEGYDINLVLGYNLNPSQGYSVNPAEGYNINPADGSNANSQGIHSLGPHGFGGGYNANPQGNDILDPLGFGGGVF